MRRLLGLLAMAVVLSLGVSARADVTINFRSMDTTQHLRTAQDLSVLVVPQRPALCLPWRLQCNTG